MEIRIEKNDNKVFVRVVKGAKVVNDIALSAAKRLIHKGWEIESPLFDKFGRPLDEYPEPTEQLSATTDDAPEMEYQPSELTLMNQQANELELDDAPEVFTTDAGISNDEITELKAKAGRARSAKSVELLIDEYGGIDADLDAYFQERIEKLNK